MCCYQRSARSENRLAIAEILEPASFDPAIARAPADFDADRDALNVENGVIDLRTGALRPHNRADNITKLASVPYDPAASCPRWTAFSARVIPNKAFRKMLQTAVAYSMTGRVRASTGLEECHSDRPPVITAERFVGDQLERSSET